MAFDNRQIQTAVLDRADSDEPVVCPTELDELLAFREEHAGHRFFCGELLGGCGFELGTRRGESRVCHFYHLANPGRPACGRREKTAGVASADHLYILKSTKSWLRGQGRDPKYRFSEHNETAPPGSLIDITSEGLNLRFHSDPALPLDWGGEDGPELVLGPNVRVDSATLRRRGYVNRFMMRSEGSKRVLLFCTVFPDSGVSEWYPVERCEITAEGRLKTPALKEFVASAPPSGDAVPTADADAGTRGPVQIGSLVRLLAAGRQGGQVSAVRGLLQAAEDAKARCEGIALEKLEEAAAQAQDWLDERDKNRRWVFRRLREAVDSERGGAVGTWLKEAREAVRRDDAPTEEEAALLAAAESIWTRWRGRTLQARSRVQPRTLSWIPPNDVQRPTPARPAPKPVKTAKAADTQKAKHARRAARVEITALLARLETGASTMSATEYGAVLEDLERAEAAAGHVPTRQRHDIARWKAGRPKGGQSGSSTVLAQPTAESRGHRAGIAGVLSADKLDSAAAAVRGALKKAARAGETTSWSRLRTQLGSALPRMTPAERLDVLIRVDQATPPDQPLLSALAAAGDPEIASRFRSVAAAHGRDIPIDDNELRRLRLWKWCSGLDLIRGFVPASGLVPA
jgi:hypothetical protein